MENQKKAKKYILYGASFNPPHIGHFSAISQMLEEYDYVIVFPYPKKFAEGKVEELPPISQRIKMLQLFVGDFFPQMRKRLVITDLAAEYQEHKKNEISNLILNSFINNQHIEKPQKEIIHTYDYLKFVKSRLSENEELVACLGFESQNISRKEEFFNEESIKSEFPHFYLQEETAIKSQDLRAFFSNHRNLKSKKDEQYIKSLVGDSLAMHIFENNLYGINNKTLSKKNKI